MCKLSSSAKQERQHIEGNDRNDKPCVFDAVWSCYHNWAVRLIAMWSQAGILLPHRVADVCASNYYWFVCHYVPPFSGLFLDCFWTDLKGKKAKHKQIECMTSHSLVINTAVRLPLKAQKTSNFKTMTSYYNILAVSLFQMAIHGDSLHLMITYWHRQNLMK